MFTKPRILAHIGFGFVVLGLVISLIVPQAYPVSLGLWLIGVFAGISALIKNGRLFPTVAQIKAGGDEDKLDILQFVEVYLSLVPGIFTIAYLIFITIIK